MNCRFPSNYVGKLQLDAVWNRVAHNRALLLVTKLPQQMAKAGSASRLSPSNNLHNIFQLDIAYTSKVIRAVIVQSV
jgi:hypothetical protein